MTCSHAIFVIKSLIGLNQQYSRSINLANVASVIKDEIIRLARKELRSETEKLKKASAQYRSEIAALKRRSVELEKKVSRLEKCATKNVEVKTEPTVN